MRKRTRTLLILTVLVLALELVFLGHLVSQEQMVPALPVFLV